MALITGPLDETNPLVPKVRVNTPDVMNEAGYLILAGENHSGAVGVPKIRRALRVTPDGRLRTGIDSILWQDTFNHGIQDTTAYAHITTTMTLAMAGGYLSFNSGNSTAAAAVARVQTYRTFTLNAGSTLEVVFRARFSSNPPANVVAELGLGYATGTTVPADGVYFKYNTSGALVGVVNFNGTELSTDPMPNAPALESRYYRIVVDQDRAEFYIDGECYGVIEAPNTSSAITFSRALPLLMRLYNNAVALTAQRMEVSDVAVITRDLALNRLWATTMAGMEQGSYNNPRGIAAGQTANYANSAAPVSATLSNTAAGYTTLGGQFQFAAVAGAETDYALFAFQVPVSGAANGNRNLVIRGVRIETFNMGAAVATTPTLLQWSLGVGATAVSLATADSATAGTKGVRRIPLGVQSLAVGTPIGGAAPAIDINLDAPVYVSPGTFVHLVLKMPVGTATASQIVRGLAFVNGFYE